MQRQITYTYPDVLGMLSGGTRLHTEVVQAALGIYPRSSVVGQPFEALVLMQSVCDQPVSVNVKIQLPRRDAGGNRLSLFTPQDTITVTVQAGEVGLLHIPIVPQLPTAPTNGLAVSIVIEGRRPRNAKPIRVPEGGRVAGLLPMSPYRRQLLYEVGFSGSSAAPNSLISRFDILPGHILSKTGDLSARYETLWNGKSLAEDQEKYATIQARAQQVSATLTRTKVYKPLLDETEKHFRQVDLPLLPGELIAAAKLMTYVMEDGLELEGGFRLTEGHWFQLLAAHIEDDELLSDPAQLIAALYKGILYDSVRLGYHMLSRTVQDRVMRDELGTPADHAAQAAYVVNALDGAQPLSLSHVYVPFVLAGLMLHSQVKAKDENLWASLDQIRVDWRRRTMSGTSGSPTIAKLMDSFLQNAEQFLIRSRVPR